MGVCVYIRECVKMRDRDRVRESNRGMHDDQSPHL